jgi:hypothetical protein
VHEVALIGDNLTYHNTTPGRRGSGDYLTALTVKEMLMRSLSSMQLSGELKMV